MATLGNPKASSLFSVLQVAVTEGTGTTPPPIRRKASHGCFLGAAGSQGAIDDQKINLLGLYLAELRRVGDLDFSPIVSPYG